MIFLLDTNVVSALRRPKRFPNLVNWLKRQPEDQLYISVITIGEIRRGIERQQSLNPAFAADLNDWLLRIKGQFADRFVGFGTEESDMWGVLMHRMGNFSADLQIAATALVHDATVVSDDKGFAATGVRLENPFD